MTVDGFASFGGRHPDAAAARNLLAHAGVVNPFTKRAFTEAAVLGLSGGIGCGYANCPSIFRHGNGSGVQPVARGWFSWDGGWHRTVFERIGLKPRAVEASSPQAGTRKLADEIAAGRPALVQWVRGLEYTGHAIDGAGCGSVWAIVVHAIDVERGTAEVADLAPSSLEVTVESLETARGTVCTHRNRYFVLDRAPSPAAATTARSFLAGARQCAEGQARPRMKSYSLAGLEQWAQSIDSPRLKDGWLQVFPGGKLFWALHDLFESVETAGTGGGLMRPLWAEFLEEAAEVTKRAALRACAKSWRELGEQWTALAEAALPDAVKPFRKARELLRRWHDAFVREGAKGRGRIEKARDEFHALRRELTASSPLGRSDAQALLDDLGRRLRELHRGEKAAFDALAAAVR